MDYYSILGVNKNAGADEIKKAFRGLASKHHPDKGGDTKKFQEIQEAYATLSDPEKKAQYDNPAPQGFSPFGQDPFGGWQQASPGNGFEQFFHQFGPDIGSLFGQRRGPARNRNINLETALTLEEAYTGKEVIATYRLGNNEERTFEVKIPPGVHDGLMLRISGAGDNSIRQLPPGDAMLTIRIHPHHRFQRNGNDVIEEVSIPVWTAILGGDIEVETIGKSKLTLALKEGTQPNAMLRIQGHGMPDINNPAVKGNHMVSLKIVIPSNLTEFQKNTLKSILP
jgi:curved DNA-binding protein